MDNQIFNKMLNISSEDVINEDSIDTLNDWKNLILKKNDDIKFRLDLARKAYSENCSEENKSKLIRTSDARKHNLSFMKIIDDRIRTVKKKNGQGMSKYIRNLINFKETAKEILPEDLYEEINCKAKIKTEEYTVN